MDLVPPKPRYLQGIGQLSLSDQKTWNVGVKVDSQIQQLSPQEAIKQYSKTPFIQDLISHKDKKTLMSQTESERKKT
jgi:hypothetical protein